MTFGEFEDSLCRSTKSEPEKNWIRARAFEAMGDTLFGRGDLAAARAAYMRALRKDWRIVKTWAKLFFLLLGPVGRHLRRFVIRFREKVMVPVARAIS